MVCHAVEPFHSKHYAKTLSKVFLPAFLEEALIFESILCSRPCSRNRQHGTFPLIVQWHCCSFQISILSQVRVYVTTRATAWEIIYAMAVVLWQKNITQIWFSDTTVVLHLRSPVADQIRCNEVRLHPRTRRCRCHWLQASFPHVRSWYALVRNHWSRFLEENRLAEAVDIRFSQRDILFTFKTLHLQCLNFAEVKLDTMVTKLTQSI